MERNYATQMDAARRGIVTPELKKVAEKEPVLIPFLRKVKAGQKEREEGVPSHQKKAGTPTMGGVMFLAAFTAVSLLFRKEGAEVVPVLFLTLGFGLIGFLDDYLKVVLHRSDGLYPKQKMALQAVITAVFLWYLARFSGISLRMRIPFLPGKELDAGIFTIPFLAFVILEVLNTFHAAMNIVISMFLAT